MKGEELTRVATAFGGSGYRPPRYFSPHSTYFNQFIRIILTTVLESSQELQRGGGGALGGN